MAKPPLIEFAKVTKGFGGRTVLNEVDLTITEGEVTTIIGKSGTGKSVLIKHIIGLLTPDSGDILIRGRALSEMTRIERKSFKREVSYMFQNNALFDSMTVFDNIALPLKEKTRLPAAKIEALVREKAEFLEVGETLRKYPSQLSGGMQKRVALARALVTDPKIVLFDEPTTGLDPIRKNAVLTMIVHYQERLGFTAIMVSHDIPDVFFISNRVAILDEGKIIFQGPPVELEQFDHPVVSEFVDSVDKLKEELTGLVTRQNFERRYTQEFGLFRRPENFLVILFSIDHLEDVAQHVGEIAAQTIISEVAGLIDKYIGPVGVSTRFSLEEILSVLPRTGMDEAERIRTRIGHELTRNKVLQGDTYPNVCYSFSVSAGIAEGRPGQDLLALVAKAKAVQKPLAELTCQKGSE